MLSALAVLESAPTPRAPKRGGSPVGGIAHRAGPRLPDRYPLSRVRVEPGVSRGARTDPRGTAGEGARGRRAARPAEAPRAGEEDRPRADRTAARPPDAVPRGRRAGRLGDVRWRGAVRRHGHG